MNDKTLKKLKIKKRIQLTGHNAGIYALERFDEENTFLSGAGDGWVVSWDLKDPEMGRLLAKVETQIFALHYLQDHNMAVVGNMNGGIHWIPLEHPEQGKNIAHHKKGIFDFYRIGDTLISVGGEGLLTKWDISGQRSLESLHLTNQSLRCIDYAPELDLLAVGASDNCIYLLNPNTFEVVNKIPEAHNNSVFSLKFSPDNQWLISGGRDALLKVWRLSDLSSVSSQPAHWYTINAIAFHPQGHLFATASRDRTVKIWDSNTFQLLKVLDTIRDGGHINSVNNLYWSTYENTLISCSDDRTIILWT